MASKLIALDLLGWDDILEDGNFLWESEHSKSLDNVILYPQTAALNPLLNTWQSISRRRRSGPNPSDGVRPSRFTPETRLHTQPHATPPYTRTYTPIQVRDRVQLPPAHGLREERARRRKAVSHRAAADNPRPALRRVAGVWRPITHFLK